MAKTQTINITPPAVRQIEVGITGTSPLITHAWSEKAKRQMLGTQLGEFVAKKAAKDPVDDYEGATYRDHDGNPSFPANGFKKAVVDAAVAAGMFKTTIRRALFVTGTECADLLKIDGNRRMRQDMVRLNRSKADVRFRPEFPKWATKVVIDFDERQISAEQIVNLINLAGFSTGIGEWRPERDGGFGRFRVSSIDGKKIGGGASEETNK